MFTINIYYEYLLLHNYTITNLVICISDYKIDNIDKYK